jgi:hypothetical protein
MLNGSNERPDRAPLRLYVGQQRAAAPVLGGSRVTVVGRFILSTEAPRAEAG